MKLTSGLLFFMLRVHNNTFLVLVIAGTQKYPLDTRKIEIFNYSLNMLSSLTFKKVSIGGKHSRLPIQPITAKPASSS
jgi:hypothetical protein